MSLTAEYIWTIDLRNDAFKLEFWCELDTKKEHLIWLTFNVITFFHVCKWHDRKHPIEIFYFNSDSKDEQWYTRLEEFSGKCFACLGLNDIFLYPSSYGDIDCINT